MSDRFDSPLDEVAVGSVWLLYPHEPDAVETVVIRRCPRDSGGYGPHVIGSSTRRDRLDLSLEDFILAAVLLVKAPPPQGSAS